MRCNRRKNDDDCPCCNRAAEKMESALSAMFQMFSHLAALDSSAAISWKELLRDKQIRRRCSAAIGQENLPALDDCLPDTQPEE